MAGTRLGGLVILAWVVLVFPGLMAEETGSPEAAAADAALEDALPPAELPRLGRDALPDAPAPAASAGTEDVTSEGSGKPDKHETGEDPASGKGPAWSRAPEDLPKGLLKNLARLLEKMENKDNGSDKAPKSLPSQANGKAKGHHKPKGKP